jgi:uncharacterized protein
MPDYRTPGVYVEEIVKFPPSVAPVATAIPAFIGYTEFARKDGNSITGLPTRISSLLEYEDYFGRAQVEENIQVTIDRDFRGTELVKEVVTANFRITAGIGPSRHIMYYALQLYFSNGGGPCYIVSVDDYLDDFGTPISDPIPFQAALNELSKEDEPTLIVFPEAQNMDSGTYTALQVAALAQCQLLGDRFVIMDLQGTGLNAQGDSLRSDGDILGQADAFRDQINGDTNLLKYGAAYYPNIRSTFNYRYFRENPDDNAVQVVVNTRQLNDNVVNAAAPVAYSAIPERSTRSKVRLAIDQFSIFLPPSAAVAGVYARVDSTRGVWKAPANENIYAIDAITCKVTDQTQQRFNVDDTAGLSINVIRAFEGRGIKIWGGRTLAGNDNEWRYINVRRFFNFVEESVKKATFPFVFEPNDLNTWVRVQAMIENFLIIQWRAGALQGVKPEHAFYVSVGLGRTMTALDILEGRMIIEIGMAAVRPAEFIILRFSHKMAES